MANISLPATLETSRRMVSAGLNELLHGAGHRRAGHRERPYARLFGYADQYSHCTNIKTLL
jgi:hypothetical protein